MTEPSMQQIGEIRPRTFLTVDPHLPLCEAHIAPPASLVSALVVDHACANALPIIAALVSSHFHVTVADTFPRANARLLEHPPSLLITQIRLAEYNGLQLVLHGKERYPAMAAVVLSTLADRVLQADAEEMGATFVVTPVDPEELMAAALRTLMRGAARTSDPIRPPFERRKHDQDLGQATPAEERSRTPRRRNLEELMACIPVVSTRGSNL